MRRRALVVLAGLALVMTVVSGVGAHSALAQAEADGWSERAPLPLPRSETSTAQLGSRLFVMGGYPGARITSDVRPGVRLRDR
jgi:hypothetical protein